MEAIKSRRNEYGSTTEVSGRASGPRDPVDDGRRKDPASRFGACSRIGEQLGVNAETLRGWVSQAEVDVGGRPGTTSGDAHELAGLKRENRELRRSNAILRSASVFFAAELDRPSR